MPETVFSVLKKEHKEIKALLKKAEKDPGQFQAFTEELTTHVRAEEQTVYKPLMKEQAVHEMILEGLEEHHVVNLVVKEMQKSKAGDEVWKAKFKVMTENLEHHIEEEEQQMFPAAEKAIGREKAVQMAEQYSKAEKQLVGTT